MAKNLVIVESPAKAKTIEKFLGSDYTVKSCFGHIRDLAEGELSVDVAKDFVPKYIIPEDKKKVVSELKKLAKEAETIWLATDEDREGEAISWHLKETLDLEDSKIKRIVFIFLFATSSIYQLYFAFSFFAFSIGNNPDVSTNTCIIK